MNVAYIEMPAEQLFRVQVDGQRVGGKFTRDPQEEGRFFVHVPVDLHEYKTLRTKPHSREGAALLVAFHHVEEERKCLGNSEVS